MTPHTSQDASPTAHAHQELERAQQMRYYHIQRRSLAARRRLMLVVTEIALLVLFGILAFATSMPRWLIVIPFIFLAATLALGRKAAIDGRRNDERLLEYIHSLGGQDFSATPSTKKESDANEDAVEVSWNRVHKNGPQEGEAKEFSRVGTGFFANRPQTVLENSDEAISMPQAPQWSVTDDGNFVEMDYREVEAGYGQIIDYGQRPDEEIVAAQPRIDTTDNAVDEAGFAEEDADSEASVGSDYVVGQYTHVRDNEPAYTPTQQRWIAGLAVNQQEDYLDRPLTLADEVNSGEIRYDSRGRYEPGWTSTQIPASVHSLKPKVHRAVYHEAIEGQASAAFAKIESTSHVPFRPTALSGVAEEDIVEPGGQLVFDQVDSILDRRRAANQ